MPGRPLSRAPRARIAIRPLIHTCCRRPRSPWPRGRVNPRIRRTLALTAAAWLLTATGVHDARSAARPEQVGRPALAAEDVPPQQAVSWVGLVDQHMRSRLAQDLAALERFRPGYRFWRHVFTVPDGVIVFGSSVDGRLIGRIPSASRSLDDAAWDDDSVAKAAAGHRLTGEASRRRDEIARLLEPSAGPLLHNPTRGRFLLPNAERYGAFTREWGAIYERFGVPAEIGLAQAIVESGLSGTVRSEARAIGFCQWLSGNWQRLKRLAPHAIEGHNQTTQAPYCAAYLSILATKYASFVPALSAHHTGGTNIGRTLVNGERLGGADVRERYFMGGEFARDLRALFPRTFRDVYGTYGPRSFLYAEMVFGNASTANALMAGPQTRVFAMRTTRAIRAEDIARRTGLSILELRRFNPALLARVPAGATLYLPMYVPAYGRDVAFWHRPPSDAYSSVLFEFIRLDRSIEDWESPGFDAVLEPFRKRFQGSASEEGAVMSTVLAYVIEERRVGRQPEILAEFRSSERIRMLFERARAEREIHRASGSTVVQTGERVD